MLSLKASKVLQGNMRRLGANSVLFLLVSAALGAAQPLQSRSPDFAVFSKVETKTFPTGLDLTIFCSKPVTPGFTQLKDPERLVIDLPDTMVGSHPNAIPLNGADVRDMRINQFQLNPPVTRVVLDLVGERGYSFEPLADRNAFVVHLRNPAMANLPARPAVVVEGTAGLGLPQGAGHGAIVLAGSRIAPGSAITAGGETAILRMERGGEVRICPGTTASVTPSANGRSMMTGMSEGAVELHYPLAVGSDTVLTPDFRILLPGPGEYHMAISADPKGNTCVRALQGNTATASVSELMGGGTYQVKVDEQVVFHSGRIARADANVPLECGCPPPRQPQLLAGVVDAGGQKSTLAPGSEPVGTATASAPNGAVTVQMPAADISAQNKPQVVVDAPFVFRASDVPQKNKADAEAKAGAAPTALHAANRI